MNDINRIADALRQLEPANRQMETPTVDLLENPQPLNPYRGEKAHLINTSQLLWHKDQTLFSASASDCHVNIDQWPQRLTLVSRRTGARKVFHTPTMRTENQDLLWVDYYCEGMVLRLFND